MTPRKNVDPETGEVLPEEAKAYETAEVALRSLPDFSKVKAIETVVGKRPPLFNLRDHPEFDGRAFTIVRVKEAEGEYGYHLYLAGFLAASERPDDKPQACILRTGSEFVLGRVVPAIPAINEQRQPLFGILRAAGRAWLFE